MARRTTAADHQDPAPPSSRASALSGPSAQGPPASISVAASPAPRYVSPPDIVVAFSLVPNFHRTTSPGIGHSSLGCFPFAGIILMLILSTETPAPLHVSPRLQQTPPLRRPSWEGLRLSLLVFLHPPASVKPPLDETSLSPTSILPPQRPIKQDAPSDSEPLHLILEPRVPWRHLRPLLPPLIDEALGPVQQCPHQGS